MASGLSKRMQKDKLMLKYKNKFIFENAVDLIAECDFCDSIVITNNLYIKDYCSKKNIKTLDNPKNENGQSESIKLAVKYFQEMDAICFFVADQPFLTSSTVNKLIHSFKIGKIYQLKYIDTVGNPVIFDKKFFEQLLSLNNDEKGSVVIRKNRKYVQYIEAEKKSEFFDIDTEKDYERITNGQDLFD